MRMRWLISGRLIGVMLIWGRMIERWYDEIERVRKIGNAGIRRNEKSKKREIKKQIIFQFKISSKSYSFQRKLKFDTFFWLLIYGLCIFSPQLFVNTLNIIFDLYSFYEPDTQYPFQIDCTHLRPILKLACKKKLFIWSKCYTLKIQLN